MRAIHTSQIADPDGTLRLMIPVANPGQLYRVIVVLDEQPAAEPHANQWPPGFIDATAGAWQGNFEGGPEGPWETREPL